MCLIGQGYLNCGVPISPRPFNWSMDDADNGSCQPSIANHEYQSALINKGIHIYSFRGVQPVACSYLANSSSQAPAPYRRAGSLEILSKEVEDCLVTAGVFLLDALVRQV